MSTAPDGPRYQRGGVVKLPPGVDAVTAFVPDCELIMTPDGRLIRFGEWRRGRA